MRKYQTLWETIKKDSLLPKPLGVTVAAHQKLHRCIIKGLIKEKGKDTELAFNLSEIGEYSKLEIQQSGNTIKFKLNYILTVEAI